MITVGSKLHSFRKPVVKNVYPLSKSKIIKCVFFFFSFLTKQAVREHRYLRTLLILSTKRLQSLQVILIPRLFSEQKSITFSGKLLPLKAENYHYDPVLKIRLWQGTSNLLTIQYCGHPASFNECNKHSSTNRQLTSFSLQTMSRRVFVLPLTYKKQEPAAEFLRYKQEV